MTRSDGNNEIPLIDNVRSWLDRAGYPVELRTARAFRRVGAEVQVGQFYVDQEEGEDKAREIDVIATFDGYADFSRTRVVVSFVIECKSSKHPWVMVATPGQPWDLPMQTRVYKKQWGVVIDKELEGWVPSRPCIDLTGQIAHSGVRAVLSDTKQSRDDVYSAISSSTKAAFWFATSGPYRSDVIHIVFPVIVFGGHMFACSLGDNAEDVTVAPIDTGIPLRWNRPLGNRRTTVVDVVVEDGLNAYVSETVEMVRNLRNRFR